MKLKSLSTITIMVSMCILSIKGNPVIRRLKGGERQRRQEYGVELEKTDAADFSPPEALQKPEIPALYSLPRAADPAGPEDEQRVDSNQQNEQLTTTEPSINFPQEQGRQENDFGGTIPVEVEQSTSEQPLPPLIVDTNSEDLRNQIQPFKGYGINFNNGQRSSEQDLDEYNKRFNSIVKAHIPPASNETPQIYSQRRPVDQQQVENSYFQQEHKLHQENQQGEERAFDQYQAQPQPIQDQITDTNGDGQGGYGFQQNIMYEDNRRFPESNQNGKNLDTNVIEAAVDENDSSFEGLENDILDAKLLERVQQIIDDHERQQREFLQRVRQNQVSLPKENGKPEFQKPGQYQDVYQGQSYGNTEQGPSNLFRGSKSFPGSPNLEFQPALLGGEFFTGRSQDNYMEHFRQNIEKYQNIDHSQQFLHQNSHEQSRGSQVQQMQHKGNHQHHPVQIFNHESNNHQMQNTQRPESYKHLHVSEEAGFRFPSNPKTEEGFRPSFPNNHGQSYDTQRSQPHFQNLPRPHESENFVWGKSEYGFRGFQTNPQSSQYLPPGNGRYEAPYPQNNNVGQNPNIITRTIVIHEQPIRDGGNGGGPEGILDNRAIITGDDLAQPRQAQQYNNNNNEVQSPEQPQFQFISASAQLRVGGENQDQRVQLNNFYNSPPPPSYLASNENEGREIEKPKPIYGVPIAPVLGPESLDDSIIVDSSAQMYNSPPQENTIAPRNGPPPQRYAYDGNNNNGGSPPQRHSYDGNNNDSPPQNPTESWNPISGLYRLPNSETGQNANFQHAFRNGESERRAPTPYGVNALQRRNIHKRFSTPLVAPLAGFFSVKNNKA